MKKHNLIQTLIIGATVLIGELHTFFEKSKVAGKWIYNYPLEYPIRLQNYVYDNGVMINLVLYFVFAYKLGKRPTMWTMFLVKMFLLWQIVDIPLYWYNYRTFGYGWVYFGLIVIGFISWNWQKIKTIFSR